MFNHKNHSRLEARQCIVQGLQDFIVKKHIRHLKHGLERLIIDVLVKLTNGPVQVKNVLMLSGDAWDPFPCLCQGVKIAPIALRLDEALLSHHTDDFKLCS